MSSDWSDTMLDIAVTFFCHPIYMIIGIHPKYLNLFFFSWSWRCLHELLSTEGGGDGEDESNQKENDRI